MGIFALDLKEAVINPTLNRLKQWTPATEVLLLGTASIMSNLGERLYSGQQNRLFGIFQINQTTHRKIWDEHLAFNSDLASGIRGLASQRTFLENPEQELITNLAYATAIAWASYDSNATEFPSDANNFLALAVFWFDHYPHNLADSQRDSAICEFVNGIKAISTSLKGKPHLAA